VPPKQFPVQSLPLNGFPPKPEIIFVRINQWVELPEPVARVAAPAVIGRIIREVSTNGVDLNVPITGEEIAVALYQACRVPTLPQGAAPAVSVVDIPNVCRTRRVPAAELGVINLCRSGNPPPRRSRLGDCYPAE
jgi:hypothetical protein